MVARRAPWAHPFSGLQWWREGGPLKQKWSGEKDPTDEGRCLTEELTHSLGQGGIPGRWWLEAG